MQVFWWVVREPALFHPASHGEMQVYRYFMVADLGESVSNVARGDVGGTLPDSRLPRLSATAGRSLGRRVSWQPRGRASVKLTHQPESEPTGFEGCVSRTETGGRFDGINTHQSARQPANDPTLCPETMSATQANSAAPGSSDDEPTGSLNPNWGHSQSETG